MGYSGPGSLSDVQQPYVGQIKVGSFTNPLPGMVSLVRVPNPNKPNEDLQLQPNDLRAAMWGDGYYKGDATANKAKYVQTWTVFLSSLPAAQRAEVYQLSVANPNAFIDKARYTPATGSPNPNPSVPQGVGVKSTDVVISPRPAPTAQGTNTQTQQAGLPPWLMWGLVAGAGYMFLKKK